MGYLPRFRLDLAGLVDAKKSIVRVAECQDFPGPVHGCQIVYGVHFEFLEFGDMRSDSVEDSVGLHGSLPLQPPEER
jgi:hypothetical protein